MGLKNRSSFIYGHNIISGQNVISIDEGSGETAVTLKPGGYTFSELATELQRALNEASVNSYSVSVNRTTRKFTVSQASTFEILAATGDFAGSDVYSKLGFNADKTGANSYQSDLSTGTVYRPQCPLFDYVDSNNNQDAVEASINQSGNGAVEIIKFGRNYFMECSIRYINDLKQDSQLFESNKNAVSEALAFLVYITDKNRIEFMPDRDNVNQYEKLILEKTSRSDKGLGFSLLEMTGQGLIGYFDTGKLTFRRVA